MNSLNPPALTIEYNKQIRCKVVEAKLVMPPVSAGSSLAQSIASALGSPILISGRSSTASGTASISSGSTAISFSATANIMSSYASIAIDEANCPSTVDLGNQSSINSSSMPFSHHYNHHLLHLNRRINSQKPGKRWEKTSPVDGTNSPFWGEEFLFDQVDADHIHRLSVTAINRDTEWPVGQVRVPAPLISANQIAEEQWLPLLADDLENDVSGEIRIRLSFVPALGGQSCRFSVTVVSARNLAPRNGGSSASPFVSLHLLPDLRVCSTQLTQVRSGLNPTFDELFQFACDDILNPDIEIHVAIWHRSVSERGGKTDDVFMGQTALTLKDALAGKQTDLWYTLLPKPPFIGDLNAALEKRRRFRMWSKIMSKPSYLVLALQTSDGDFSLMGSSKKPHKLVDFKSNAATFCGHCSGVVWPKSSQFQCKECKLACHIKCSKFIKNNCGSLSKRDMRILNGKHYKNRSKGMIKMKIKYTITPYLPIQNYDKMLETIEQENYQLATFIGFVCQEREEIAKILVRVFECQGKVIDFLKSICTNEIQAASNDYQTLFRANSMASKAVDIFMKHVASKYLKAILGPVLQSIVRENQNCEVDPTRLDPKKDNIEQNWEKLIEYVDLVISAIFKGAESIPEQLRHVFQHIKQKTFARFVNDAAAASHISVAGFIFLRFFVPAILNPKLFGIFDEFLDAKTSRKFTLIAKSVQNLANLVEFGHKEPFMVKMNSWINGNQEKCRAYIQQISTAAASESGAATIRAQKEDLLTSDQQAIYCAHLYEILSQAIDKLNQAATDPIKKEMLGKLLTELQNITRIKDQAKNGEDHALNDESVEESANIKSTSLSRSVVKGGHDIHRNSHCNMEDPAMEMIQQSFKSITIITEAADNCDNLLVHPATTNGKNSISESVSSKTTTDDADVDAIKPTVERRQSHVSSDGYPAAALLENYNEMNSPKTTHAPNDWPVIDDSLANMPPTDATDSTMIESDSIDSNSVKSSNRHFRHSIMHKLPAPRPYNPDNCAACDNPASTGPSMEALGKKWHVECFCCTACGQPITSTFIPIDNLPYCKPDYLKRMGFSCGTCGETIEADYIDVLGRKYHVECKLCEQCQKPLAGRHYVIVNGCAICMEHRQEFMKCFECREVIDGQYLVAGKRNYHPEHFNCEKCQKNLAGRRFFELSNVDTFTPCCQRCWLEAAVADLSNGQ